jgi:hypothetical protein
VFKYLQSVSLPIPKGLVEILINAEWKLDHAKQNWIQYQLWDLFKTPPDQFPIELKDSVASVVVSEDLFYELKQQYEALVERFGPRDTHIRYVLGDPTLFDKLCKFEPFKSLSALSTNISSQIITDRGNGLFPHTEIYCKAGFLYLLEGEEYETIWYDYPADPLIELNKYGFKYNVPDPSKLVEAYRTKLKPHTWYLFDHTTYHRVEPINPAARTGPPRKAISIDFYDCTVQDLINVMDRSKIPS